MRKKLGKEAFLLATLITTAHTNTAEQQRPIEEKLRNFLAEVAPLDSSACSKSEQTIIAALMQATPKQYDPLAAFSIKRTPPKRKRTLYDVYVPKIKPKGQHAATHKQRPTLYQKVPGRPNARICPRCGEIFSRNAVTPHLNKKKPCEPKNPPADKLP